MTAVPSHPPAARSVLPTAALVGIALILWLAVAFLMFAIFPRVEKHYDDFGLALPTLTRHLIRVSGWAVRSWPVAILIGLAGHGLTGVAYALARRELRVGRPERWRWTVLLLPPAATLGVCALALLWLRL